MKYELFGKEINIKDNYCSLDGCKGRKIDEPYVNMYVVLTNTCNANCAFCCNPTKVDKAHFDFYKFYYILHEIRLTYGLKINKLSFTGGEPTLSGMLEHCVRAVKNLDEDIFTVVNTNGSKLETLIPISQYFDSIAISRHYHNDDANRSIFNCHNHIATEEEIKTLPYKNKVHLSCNLQKGYMDNIMSVKTYLEHAAAMGIDDVGFVSLMPVNDYCKENFVDFKDIEFDAIDNLFISKEWNNKDSCRCRNYLYLPSNTKAEVDVVKVYTRYYVDPSYCSGTLVFDGQNLRMGFNGEIII